MVDTSVAHTFVGAYWNLNFFEILIFSLTVTLMHVPVFISPFVVFRRCRDCNQYYWDEQNEVIHRGIIQAAY